MTPDPRCVDVLSHAPPEGCREASEPLALSMSSYLNELRMCVASSQTAPVRAQPFSQDVNPNLCGCEQGKGTGSLHTKCGKCQTCSRPTMHKPCLNPIPKAGGSEDVADSWSRRAP